MPGPQRGQRPRGAWEGARKEGPKQQLPTPAGAWDRGPRREAGRRQMAHARGGGRLAAAPGCPRRGLPLLGGGGGEQPPARPPGLSGGLETADRAQPGARREGRGGPKERAVGKGLLEERRGHRAPAALPLFRPGELRKAQRAETGVTGWGAGESLSTRALMHKGGGSWRSAQSFLITVPSVAVAHVRVPRPTPTPPRPGCLLPAQWQSGCQGIPTSPLPHPARFLSSLFHF